MFIAKAQFWRALTYNTGMPPNLGYQQGNFTAMVRARNGTLLFTFDVWDPRTEFGDTEISDPASGSTQTAGSG